MTGRLSSMSRSEAQERIKERGGSASGSVSRRTDFVVVGEEPGSKADDALRLGGTDPGRRGLPGAPGTDASAGTVTVRGGEERNAYD